MSSIPNQIRQCNYPNRFTLKAKKTENVLQIIKCR